MKHSPQHVTGGYLGSSYPEGNADRTSLGGWQSDLKFGKNRRRRRDDGLLQHDVWKALI